jgi:tetratricopeptide (TPR) repeat protein
MQHVTDEIKAGPLADYAQITGQYDHTKLDATGLKELAHLFAESGNLTGAIGAGESFILRFGDRPHMVPSVRRLIADCIVRLGQGDLDKAIIHYQASLTQAIPLAEKLDVYARLILLQGIEQDIPKQAAKLLAQAETAVKAAQVDEESRAAYRRVLIASGDVQLWHAKPDEARLFYQRAEALTGRFIPPQVRAARVGAFPNAIREFLAAGNHQAALDVVNRWEETFPNEKIHGQTFYWRGKLLGLSGKNKEAARYLARAIGLALGADFESESRWLLALSFEKLGRTEDARKELARLVASGFNDAFTKSAREKLGKSHHDGAKK